MGNSCHHTSSPRKIRPRYFSWCSSKIYLVPMNSAMVIPITSTELNRPETTIPSRSSRRFLLRNPLRSDRQRNQATSFSCSARLGSVVIPFPSRCATVTSATSTPPPVAGPHLRPLLREKCPPASAFAPPLPALPRAVGQSNPVLPVALSG